MEKLKDDNDFSSQFYDINNTSEPFKKFQSFSVFYDENDPINTRKLIRLSLQELDMHRRWGNHYLRRTPINGTIQRAKSLPQSELSLYQQQSFSPYPNN